MIQTFDIRTDPRTAATPELLSRECARQLHLDLSRIKRLDIRRRSIDARQRRVMVNLSVILHIDSIDETASAITPINYPNVEDSQQVIIVGAGPAGLFAALELIELGLKPIVLERGKDVDSRRADMVAINRHGIVNPESNYCFGEGGAGAYSDGKLYTRSKKRGPVEKVLQIFHTHGAQKDILIDAHPHIGTDRLPKVIKAMRQTIISAGGIVKFCTRVDALIKDSAGEVIGAIDAFGNEYLGPVILATGHSARDIYKYLAQNFYTIEAKGIAVGVRLEHPQHLIDQLQYHNPEGRGKYLPAAEYSMLTRIDDRAVYSFCMCPGGFIIPAASAPGQLVVNGMSPANRGSKWANSGMVVEILPEDVPDYPDEPALKVMHFQENIEQRFFEAADNTQQAPAQRMKDFVNGKISSTLPHSSYPPGLLSRNMNDLLPESVARRLREGFKVFDSKQHGFLTNDAVLIGAETRTSAPVRIPRDPETLCHINTPGLYPCGEGAGYAGGIVSAAIDGIMCARAAAQTFINPDSQQF